jgi:hypothetical protein
MGYRVWGMGEEAPLRKGFGVEGLGYRDEAPLDKAMGFLACDMQEDSRVRS